MSYEVRCACGKAYAVGAADAGVSFPCVCGREVEVPNLHTLRASANEPPGSPLWALQAGFANGSLPGPSVCVRCRVDTPRRVTVIIECEKGATGAPALAGQVASGCFMGVLMMLVGVFIISRDMLDTPARASGLRVTVPIFLCEACDRSVVAHAALRDALRVTPEYAALLDRYPDALVRRVS